MSSNVPMIRRVSWPSIGFQLLLLSLVTYGYYVLHLEDPFIYAALTYYFLAFMLRKLIAAAHRKGIELIKKQRFKEAIPFFEKSYLFFTKNSWLDKYRYLTMLSSSGMCYKEMALCNTAF